MSTTSTALLPLDPAVSPEQVNRILPIRTNLLPEEITAGRNARRIRFVLIAAVVLVVVVVGGWYLYAVKQRDLALADSNSISRQVKNVKDLATEPKFKPVTDAINKTKTLNGDLKTALAQDLPWDTLLNQLRSAADTKNVTLTAVVGTLSSTDTISADAGTIGSLQITGKAKDKKTVADFVDAVAEIKGAGIPPFTNAYLTSATKQETNWTFTMTVDIADDTECGRFTTTCKSGGY
jgi:hypothetical protein